MQVLLDHSLQSLNTFGISAHAQRYVYVPDPESLQDALRYAQAEGLPLLVLGGGSNLLLTQDFSGLVVHMGIQGIAVVSETADDVVVEAGAGENWHQVVLHCIAHGWGGIENLSLIPGCVGAAPIQNIGAYGVELKDVFDHLWAVPVNGGARRRFDATECAFGYRDSVFKQDLRGQYIITHVGLRLRKRNHRPDTSYGAIAEELAAAGVSPAEAGIQDVSAAVIRIRQSKLPDPAVVGNAGSFFKNPELPAGQYAELKAAWPGIPGYVVSPEVTKVPAAWLIEQAGWKGKRFGNYGVHDRQALVLVNYGGAKGSELLALAEEIQASVLARFGVRLEREVNVV